MTRAPFLRAPFLLLVLLLPAAAGCLGRAPAEVEGAEGAGAPGPTDPASATSPTELAEPAKPEEPEGSAASAVEPPAAAGRGGNASQAAPAAFYDPAPRDVNLSESGALRGPFAERWTWDVERTTFLAFTLAFALDPPAGAPAPLAFVALELYDARGVKVREARLGVGESARDVRWALAAEDVAATGAWTLAVVGHPALGSVVPSGGVGAWRLAVVVDY